MKSAKNEHVLSENDENNRACNHSNKEGEYAYRDSLEAQPPLNVLATPVLHKGVDR